MSAATTLVTTATSFLLIAAVSGLFLNVSSTSNDSWKRELILAATPTWNV